jgi:hypothetical protein
MSLHVPPTKLTPKETEQLARYYTCTKVVAYWNRLVNRLMSDEQRIPLGAFGSVPELFPLPSTTLPRSRAWKPTDCSRTGDTDHDEHRAMLAPGQEWG